MPPGDRQTKPQSGGRAVWLGAFALFVLSLVLVPGLAARAQLSPVPETSVPPAPEADDLSAVVTVVEETVDPGVGTVEPLVDTVEPVLQPVAGTVKETVGQVVDTVEMVLQTVDEAADRAVNFVEHEPVVATATDRQPPSGDVGEGDVSEVNPAAHAGTGPSDGGVGQPGPFSRHRATPRFPARPGLDLRFGSTAAVPAVSTSLLVPVVLSEGRPLKTDGQPHAFVMTRAPARPAPRRAGTIRGPPASILPVGVRSLLARPG